MEIEQRQYTLASRANRFLAQIADNIFILLALSPLIYFSLNNDYLDLKNPNNSSVEFLILISVLYFVIYFALNIKLLKNNGQTLGKKFFYIKIVNQDNSQTSLKTLIFKRYLFQWGITFIPAIGDLLSLIDSLVIFGKKRECLHDKVAKTKVVNV